MKKTIKKQLKLPKRPQPRKQKGHSGMPAMDRRILQALIEDHGMCVRDKAQEWRAIKDAIDRYIYQDLTPKDARKFLRENNGYINTSRMQYFILWAVTGECTT